MHLRPLEHRDLPAVVDVMTRAFMEDELFAWLAPHRHKYIASYRKWVAHRQRARTVARATWGVVAVPSAKPEDHDRIMGHAWWVRGVGPESAPSLAIVAAAAAISPLELTEEEIVRAQREAQANDPWCNRNCTWTAAFERALLDIEARFEKLIHGNPAINYEMLAMFEAVESLLTPLEAGITHWHLGGLAVDPAYQRQGVGAELVQWGIRLAEQESREKGFSIPVSLESSEKGYNLYRRLGFRAVGWSTLPVAPTDGPAGASMVWDSRSTWVQTAPPGTEEQGRAVDAVWSQRALDKLKINNF